MIRFLLIFILIAGYDEKRLLDAIYKAEGSTKYPYGIKSLPTGGNRAKSRVVAWNTIRNNEIRWNTIKKGDYLTFLAKRYCPGDWMRWKHNVEWIYNKGGEK